MGTRPDAGHEEWPSHPLEAARRAFGWLTRRLEPLSVNGRRFDHLPDRNIPLDELGRLLLSADCPHEVWDQVWRHVIDRARRHGPSLANRGRWPGASTAVRPRQAVTSCRYYGADLADIERLASLAGGADRPTWWAPWTEVVPDWLKTFVGLEGLARTASDYATFVVPALLQTTDYSFGATISSGRDVQDQNQVAGYTRIVAKLRDIALSPVDTVEAIHARLTTLT